MTGNNRRSLKVGLVLPTIERSRPIRWKEAETVARVAEDVGFDSLWVVDHFLYQYEGEDEPHGCWECWSWLSAIAACTERVEIGTLVLGAGFRNPALLAKMADTVEEISGGRLILGLGAGYHELEYRAFGYPYDHLYSRFAEAIKIIHGLLRQGYVDFSGKYHQATDCVLKPRGPRASGPPILIGCKGPKMLKLTARYADAWNAFWDDTNNTAEGMVPLNRLVDAACVETGRDPGTLERTATVLVADPGANSWWNSMPTGYDGLQLNPLSGEPEKIAAEIAAYMEQRIGHVQIHLDKVTPQIVESLAPVVECLGRATR